LNSVDCSNLFNSGNNYYGLQLHVSSLFATTTYSLANYSIISVELESMPLPFIYSAAAIRDILNIAFYNATLNETGADGTNFLSYVVFAMNSETRSLSSQLLRNVLALPLYCVNANYISIPGDPPVPDNGLITTGYFANPVFRVVIADYSLYTFTTLALLSLLWCIGAMSYCWIARSVAPNFSQYPEIDFASKCISVSDDNSDKGMDFLLRGLGNANSKAVETRIKKEMIFIRATVQTSGSDGAVVFARSDVFRTLEGRKRYT
jgi:hypothetical protein